MPIQKETIFLLLNLIFIRFSISWKIGVDLANNFPDIDPEGKQIGPTIVYPGEK